MATVTLTYLISSDSIRRTVGRERISAQENKREFRKGASMEKMMKENRHPKQRDLKHILDYSDDQCRVFQSDTPPTWKLSKKCEILNEGNTG